MKAAELKSLQAPIKQRYRDEPKAASITLRAKGKIGEGVTCNVQTGKALVEAGLHPATGGTGLSACSGDMLLESLVACAGVTLRAMPPSTPKAISIFAELSPCPKKSRSAFNKFDCASISTRTRPKNNSPAFFG
jgi:hypothetical protein